MIQLNPRYEAISNPKNIDEKTAHKLDKNSSRCASTLWRMSTIATCVSTRLITCTERELICHNDAIDKT